jgi:hypothetical protein
VKADASCGFVDPTGFAEMPNYRFKAHGGPAGDEEKTGAAVLADDDDALAFANRVIRELMRQDSKRYTTSWMMEITAGTRSVASLPFEPAATEGGADESQSPLPVTETKLLGGD